MAAEIRENQHRGQTESTSFNEAAANGRGNRPDRPNNCPGSPRFNEAAANGRGNPIWPS